jgi:hypothetical protein
MSSITKDMMKAGFTEQQCDQIVECMNVTNVSMKIFSATGMAQKMPREIAYNYLMGIFPILFAVHSKEEWGYEMSDIVVKLATKYFNMIKAEVKSIASAGAN